MSLWRHRDFVRLWSATTASQVGSQVSALALPLAAVLVLDASAFEVALLGTIEFLPFALFALPAGVWVDRLPRRPILIAADVTRAALLASVPVAHVLDALTMPQLYAVGFCVGVGTVFFDVSYQSYLPSLVERDQLVDGNGKLEASRSGSQLAGPGLAGGLVELVTAPIAIAVDAVSYVVSALFLLRIRSQESPPPREPARSPFAGMGRELREGLRYVVGDAYIRAIASSTAVFNLFSSVWNAVLIVYLVRVLDLSAGTIGLLLTLGNSGAVAGALLAGRVGARLGIGPGMICGALTGAAAVLVPLAPKSGPIPYLVGAQLVVSFGIVIYNTLGISLMQAITPDRLLGRMNASRRFVVWGVIPLGTLAGGALASATDLRTAIWIGVVGNALAFVPLLLSPLRSLREVPEEAVAEPAVA